MADADPISFGSKQMLVNAATALFPTNGRGGTQGTVHPNFPATGTYLIEAFTIQTVGATTASTLTILQGDGSTQLCAIPIPIPAAGAPVAGQLIPIGGLNGYESTGTGLSALISNSGGTAPTVTLWFRRAG